jgi:FK506-binding protein 1
LFLHLQSFVLTLSSLLIHFLFFFNFQFEVLDAKLRNDRLLEAKTEPRGKQMDEWTMSEVVAWFESLGFPEYEPAVIKHKVDGLLLLNMADEDWKELGVNSRLHARKIETNMKKYRIRYETKSNKKERGPDDSSSSDEDSGLSDLSVSSDPSDLLEEMLELEEQEKEMNGMNDADDEGVLPPTEEELLQAKRDDENILIEVLYPGDGRSHPKEGDVVQLHYTIVLEETGKVIESSRKMRHRPFEFVVGIGQVVRGWDVAIRKFSFGERSKVTVTSSYAYGIKGYPPTIPPNAALVFDLELIKWWPRYVWVKPLVQQPGLSQKPYTLEEHEAGGGINYGEVKNLKEERVKGDDEFSSEEEDA